MVIESFEKLSLCDGCLTVPGEEEISVPLAQLSSIMLTSTRGSVSLPLLHALNENHISLIFCNGRMEPTFEVIPIAEHANAAGNILQQCSWEAQRKEALWRELVRSKIRSQISALLCYDIEIPSELSETLNDVQPADSTNREGLAARIYFRQMFGSKFLRHTEDDTNAALNYGYSILRSAFSRIIAAHGYHAAIGIHHCSGNNRFNLSCDLMEPFRPFVDVLVRQNPERALDRDYKRELVGVLYQPCCFQGKTMNVQNAIEAFSLHVFRELSKDADKPVQEVMLDFAA